MSLIGHWTLAQAEFSGGVFLDQSGNGNNATPANTPVSVTDQRTRSNGAVTLNGISDEFIIPSVALLNFGTSQDFSIAGWVKGNTETTFKGLFQKGDPAVGVNPGYGLLWRGDRVPQEIQFMINDGSVTGSITEDFDLDDGAWHFIVVTADRNGSAILYVDSSPLGSPVNISAVGNIDNAIDIQIGPYNTGGRWFDGYMDNWRLFNHILTPTEVSALYTAGLFWEPQLFTGQMNFSGSIAAQNPNWLLLDDSLAWRGEWDETITYDLDDAVLYKTGDGEEFHIFVSKATHNVGNNPTTSPAYWRRYYQEQFI